MTLLYLDYLILGHSEKEFNISLHNLLHGCNNCFFCYYNFYHLFLLSQKHNVEHDVYIYICVWIVSGHLSLR